MSWENILKVTYEDGDGTLENFFRLDELDLDEWEKAAEELLALAKDTTISHIEFGRQVMGLEISSPMKYTMTGVWQLEKQLELYQEKTQKILKIHEEFDKLSDERYDKAALARNEEISQQSFFPRRDHKSTKSNDYSRRR